MSELVYFDWDKETHRGMCSVTGLIAVANPNGRGVGYILDEECPGHDHRWSARGPQWRDGGRRFKVNSVPAKPTVPREAKAFEDLKPGMRVEMRNGERTLSLDGETLFIVCGRTRTQPMDEASFRSLGPWTILADPEEPAKAQGLSSAAALREYVEIASMNARPPMPIVARPACHPKCTFGAPCRRERCVNLAEWESRARSEGQRPVGCPLEHETQRRAKWLAEARALETARELRERLPVVRPWAMMEGVQGPGWDRRGVR